MMFMEFPKKCSPHDHFSHVSLIAKLSPTPALAGLRLALFPFDPPTHPTSHPPGIVVETQGRQLKQLQLINV